MSYSLTMLPTKIHPPDRRPDALMRARLSDALLENSHRKLLLVIAPAGYGKTTLLTDLATDPPFLAAWLTLDPADRDPQSFIRYTVAAIRERCPAFGAATLAALANTADISAGSAALARALAADAFANIPNVCMLILDDFHEVNESAAVTGFLDELLRLLPDNLRVLLSSRTLPNLTVSRLAVDLNLFGLGEAELRFTSEEIQTLFQNRYRIELTPAQALEVSEQSEGWIAGILLSAHGLWDGLLDQLIATRGAHGPLYDYLTDEAYERQPPALRRFLQASSVLRVVDVASCTALLGPGEWLARLEEAERANLFLSRLSGLPPSYRYHQLFRDYLQARLRREQPEQFHRLHLAASRMMVARREWPAALEHLHDAGAYTEAARLVGRITPELERDGHWYVLAQAIDALPEEVRAGNGMLLLARARAAAATGDAKLAEQTARNALQALPESRDRPARAWVFQVLGNALRVLGRIDEAVKALTAARTLAPRTADLLASVRRELGVCLGMRGDFEGALRELRAAHAFFVEAGHPIETARVEFNVGNMLSRLGQVGEACAEYERAAERWRAVGDRGNVALTCNNLAFLRYLQGDYEAARRLLDEGLELAQEENQVRVRANLEHTLGSLLLSGGDVEAAAEGFRRGLALAEDAGDLWAVVDASEGLGFCSLWQDDLVSADTWFERGAALAERQQSEYLSALMTLDRALLPLRSGATAQAVAGLHTGRDMLTRLHARRDVVRANAWLALALHRNGDEEDAAAHFHDALGEATRLQMPALLDLPARWDPDLFAALPANGCHAIRNEVLSRLTQRRESAPARGPAPEPRPLPRLAVRAFGRGTVMTPDGTIVEWTRDKSRELLFYLAYHGPTSAERLVADLWPEASPARGKASLYSAVYTLRQTVHPEAVRVVDRAYLLPRNLIARHDVHDFEMLVRQAHGSSDVGDRLTVLENAAALYTGPFLAETDNLWVLGVRQLHQRRMLAVLEDLIADYAALGDWRASAASAARALAIEPREDLYVHGIGALLRSGDRAAAAALLRRCRRYLARHSGTQISPALQALAKTLSRDAAQQ